MTATVTKRNALDMQVCVPADWTDVQVEDFANQQNPCGTEHGWKIRREGAALLRGDKERVECSAHPENVHIMLDA
jgi:hypothetical protein